MKLKKGSAAAKAYMAKIRAKKKTAKKKPVKKIGANLLIEKGESRKTKPARVVQVQRTKKGAFKKFATLNGINKSIGSLKKKYIAIYQTSSTVVSDAIFEATSLKEAKRIANFHKRVTPELSKVKNLRTSVKLYKK